MVVVMEERASEEQVQHVIAQLVEKGFDVHRSTGQLRSVLGAVGGNRSFDTRLIEVMDGVAANRAEGRGAACRAPPPATRSRFHRQVAPHRRKRIG